MKKLKKLLAIIAAAFVAAFGVVTMAPITASADTGQTLLKSNVLDDLKKDSTFNEADYPAKTVQELKSEGKNFLQVIKIAESIANELYVYVYQASDATTEIEAAKISIARTPENVEDTSVKVCTLSLVSTDGVFDKYRVNGFDVLDLAVRHYQLVGLYRPFLSGIDEETGNDNKNTLMCEGIGMTWYVRDTDGGQKEYAHTYDEVITITDEWHGSILYYDGFKLKEIPFTESHFIAFTTDKKIDKLKAAEIYFTTREYDYYICRWVGCKQTAFYGAYGLELGSERPQHAKLTEEAKGGNSADGWFGKREYEWQRIEELGSFRAAEDEFLSDDAKSNLEAVQSSAGENGAFVLRFIETEFDSDFFSGKYHPMVYDQAIPHPPSVSEHFNGTLVSNVAILELTFETDGITYTMGAVDSMTTSDHVSDGAHDAGDNFLANWNDFITSAKRTGRMLGVVFGAIGAFFVAMLFVRLIRRLFGKKDGDNITITNYYNKGDWDG